MARGLKEVIEKKLKRSKKRDVERGVKKARNQQEKPELETEVLQEGGSLGPVRWPHLTQGAGTQEGKVREPFLTSSIWSIKKCYPSAQVEHTVSGSQIVLWALKHMQCALQATQK